MKIKQHEWSAIWKDIRWMIMERKRSEGNWPMRRTIERWTMERVNKLLKDKTKMVSDED